MVEGRSSRANGKGHVGANVSGAKIASSIYKHTGSNSRYSSTTLASVPAHIYNDCFSPAFSCATVAMTTAAAIVHRDFSQFSFAPSPFVFLSLKVTIV